MVHLASLEVILDPFVILAPLVIFIIFLMYLKDIVPGEAKRMFVLLTIFAGLNFLGSLFFEGLEVAHVFGVHKGPLNDDMEEGVEFIAHVIQLIGLGVLFYIAILYRNFAKKLGEARNIKE